MHDQDAVNVESASTPTPLSEQQCQSGQVLRWKHTSCIVMLEVVERRVVMAIITRGFVSSGILELGSEMTCLGRFATGK